MILYFLNLQELCKELHRKIDVVDEARYDMEVKVAKNEQEVRWNQMNRITDLWMMYLDGFWNLCTCVCFVHRFSHWIRRLLS